MSSYFVGDLPSCNTIEGGIFLIISTSTCVHGLPLLYRVFLFPTSSSFLLKVKKANNLSNCFYFKHGISHVNVQGFTLISELTRFMLVVNAYYQM